MNMIQLQVQLFPFWLSEQAQGELISFCRVTDHFYYKSMKIPYLDTCEINKSINN